MVLVSAVLSSAGAAESAAIATLSFRPRRSALMDCSGLGARTITAARLPPCWRPALKAWVWKMWLGLPVRAPRSA
jgi:hypothetical protein